MVQANKEIQENCSDMKESTVEIVIGLGLPICFIEYLCVETPAFRQGRKRNFLAFPVF